MASAFVDGEPAVGTPGEREAGGHLVVGVALLGHLGDEVPEPVGDPLPPDPLERLHDVRVVAEDQVDVGRGQQRADGGDLRAGRVVVVLQAAVQARDDDLGAGRLRPRGRGEHHVDVGHRRDATSHAGPAGGPPPLSP